MSGLIENLDSQDIWVLSICNEIIKYQRKHNIKQMCVDNVFTIYSHIYFAFGEEFIKERKIQPAVCWVAGNSHSKDKEKVIKIIAPHMVLKYKNTSLDPSADVIDLGDKHVSFSLKELIKAYNITKNNSIYAGEKNIVNEYIHFLKKYELDTKFHNKYHRVIKFIITGLKNNCKMSKNYLENIVKVIYDSPHCLQYDP